MWKPFLNLTSIILALIVTAPAVDPQAADPSDPESGRILALENAWNQAVQQKDLAALNMLLAANLTYIDYDGTLRDKAEYLASVQSPVLHPVRIVSEAMNVHSHGPVVLVIGVYRESGMKEGKPYTLRERFTDAWIRRGSSWECVASQSTLITR